MNELYSKSVGEMEGVLNRYWLLPPPQERSEHLVSLAPIARGLGPLKEDRQTRDLARNLAEFCAWNIIGAVLSNSFTSFA